MFAVGDRVRWSAVGPEEMSGEQGTVIEVRPGSVRVRFDNPGKHVLLNSDPWSTRFFARVSMSPLEEEIRAYISSSLPAA